MSSPDYKELARTARKEVLTMVHRAQTSHIASNFSVIDIATVLYANLKKGDEVCWSKGWAAASIYYFLAQQGKIPKEDLLKFPNYPYIGLAETSVPGVWVNGGAVGHGTPIAVGMALGKKRAGEAGTIYCILSDGELNEGTAWESAAIAGFHKLNNLVFLVDLNGWQAMGKTNEVLDFEPHEDKWRAFRWHTERVNGHDFHAIENALGVDSGTFPKMILCDTIKGKGVSIFEDRILYHYKNIDDETYKEAMRQLQEEGTSEQNKIL